MPIDKLTQRAKAALLSLPQDDFCKSGQVLDAIIHSGGMGSVLLKAFPETKLNKKLNIDLNHLVEEGYYQALKLDHSYVGTEHLLLALLKITTSPSFNTIRLELIKMNIFPNTIRAIEKSHKTPLLDSFSVNINQRLFKDFEKPLLDREEYRSLISVLLQKNNANPLIVGEKGVGKQAMIELLAQNINYLDVPPALVGHNIYEFDLLAFMTNAFNKNSLEFVLGALIEELKGAGRVILFIKNFQNIFFTSSMGSTVPMFYSMFKSALETAGIRYICTMNASLYDKLFSENEHIFEGFTSVEVDEPDEKLVKEILKLNAGRLEQFHNVTISKELINYVYMKAKEEIKDTKFPQKALDLLDQACSRLIMKKRVVPEKYKSLVDKTFFVAQTMDKNLEMGDFAVALKNKRKLQQMENTLLSQEKKIFFSTKVTLTKPDVDDALTDLGVLDGDDVSVNNIGNLSNLGKKLKSRIIGQDSAVELMVKSLVRAKLGLRSKKRPIGNFLFLGPTGVGKTELAKVLAESAFTHGENALIRLDMSDFAEKHTVARLVGAPPGYVGYGEGGELTSKIDLQPERVVLFDEIEKAHPDVLNILLQIMEEGELKDAKGNTFDFSKAIIILTSNLGTEFLHSSGIGFDEKKIDDANIEERLKTNLKRILKPELLNRFDEIIVFKRLRKEEQFRVVTLLVNEILETLAKQKVTLKVSLDVKKLLLKLGYSEEYGARSLRRIVEKELLDRVAETLLETKDRPLNLVATVIKDRIIVAVVKPFKK